MSNKKRIKNGFTLAELSIVIALIAVLSVSIITFTSAIHAHVSTFNTVLDVADDITYCRKMVIAWVSHFDNTEYEIEVFSTEMVATQVETGSRYKLFLQQQFNEDGVMTEGVMVAQYDNGQSGTYATNNVFGVGFGQSNDKRLYKCFIQCSSAGAGSDTSARYERYDFVVHKRVS